MPIVNPTDKSPQPKTPVPVQIAPKEYKGVVVDSMIHPVHSLLTHVEGQSWTIDYYRHVIGDDNETNGLNQSRPGAYEQYIRIKNLEIRVSEPLSSVQVQDTKSFEIKGQANTYPGLIPNKGDMFIADVGDAREGVFQVVESTRMSIFKTPTYQIRYTMKGYSNEPVSPEEPNGPKLIDNLNMKIVKTVYFMKDYVQHGLNPIIEEEDYFNINKLATRYYDLIKDYYKSFFSEKFCTLLPPGQGLGIYDAFMMNALRQLFETRDAPEIIRVKNFNIMGDQVMNTQTIWDALLQREPRIIDYCAQEMGLNTLASFRSQGMLEGIYFTGIKYVVYPKKPFLSIDDEMSLKNVIIVDRKLIPTHSRTWSLRKGIPLPVLDGLPSIDPVLFRRVDTDYYTFSKAFYDRTEGMTALEILVWNYLDGKALSIAWLLELCESYRSMGGLERFYYTPIILLLIKATLRGI